MDTSMAALRKRFAAQWDTADTDGDGKVDAEEVKAAFDLDGDGVIDAKELEALAEQLASQVEFNNQLLQQLQKLEEAQARNMMDGKSQQDSLRKALGELERARNTIDTLRRKLAISQEVALKMSTQCKEARVEAGRFKREAETAQRQAAGSGDEIAALHRERDDANKRIDELEAELRLAKRSSKGADAGEKARIATAEMTAEAARRELDELRAAHAPLIQECEAARHNLTKLHEENEALKESRLAALKDADEARSLIRDAEDKARSADADADALAKALEAEREKTAAAEANANYSREAVNQKQLEIEGLHERLNELSDEGAAAQKRAAQLESELKSVSNDLLASARQREADRKAADARTKELSTDLQRLAEEAQAREAAVRADLEAQTRETLALKGAYEDKLGANRDEQTSLHAQLRDTHNDFASKLEAFDRQREDLEDQLAQQKKDAAAKEAALKKEIADAHAEREEREKELEQWRKVTAHRTELHVRMLGALQHTIKQATTEFAALRDEYGVLAVDLLRFQSHLNEAKGEQDKATEAWYGRLKTDFLQLLRRVQEAHRCREEAEDLADAAKLEAEEERSKSLMLDETVSRQKHEILEAERKAREGRTTVEARERSTAAELRRTTAIKDDLEDQVAKLSEQLDKTMEHNRELMTEASRASTSLADATSKHSEKAKAIERERDRIEAEKAALEQRHEALTSERNTLKMALARAESTISGLKKEAELKDSALARSGNADKAATMKHRAELKRLTESLKQLEQQTRQKDSLLKVLNQQREQLQGQNLELRGELDAMYRTSMARGTGDPTAMDDGAGAEVGSSAADFRRALEEMGE